jgi:hypothetical protein
VIVCKKKKKRVPKFVKKEKYPTSCVIVINKMDECPYAFGELLTQELYYVNDAKSLVILGWILIKWVKT